MSRQCRFVLFQFVLVCGLSLPLTAWASDDGSSPQRPSGNLIKRFCDDYKTVHGNGRLLDLKGKALPALVVVGGLTVCDEETYGEINRLYSGKLSDEVSDCGNWLGSLYGALTVTGGLSLLGGSEGKDDAKLLLAALADAGIDVSIMKCLAGRERPLQSGGETVFRGPSLSFSSFPSEHTAVAFAMATVLGKRHPRQQALYMTLAGLVGLARIHDHRHFLSDAVAGAMVGMDSGKRVMANEEGILRWRF